MAGSNPRPAGGSIRPVSSCEPGCHRGGPWPRARSSAARPAATGRWTKGRTPAAALPAGKPGQWKMASTCFGRRRLVECGSHAPALEGASTAGFGERKPCLCKGCPFWTAQAVLAHKDTVNLALICVEYPERRCTVNYFRSRAADSRARRPLALPLARLLPQPILTALRR